MVKPKYQLTDVIDTIFSSSTVYYSRLSKLAVICNELTGPPTQVVPQDHLCHHKWSLRTVSGPPCLWGAVCLKTTYTSMFSTGIDV